MIAKHWFQQHVSEHISVDILECQESLERDLRKPGVLDDLGQFDVVTDFGTTEHVHGDFYQAWLNIHNACKIGGLMIHENPKTGNWPGHGDQYFTEEFYEQLCAHAEYELIELTSEAAMGNTKDGWNVCAVLRKFGEGFPDRATFEGFDYRQE